MEFDFIFLFLKKFLEYARVGGGVMRDGDGGCAGVTNSRRIKEGVSFAL